MLQLVQQKKDPKVASSFGNETIWVARGRQNDKILWECLIKREVWVFFSPSPLFSSENENIDGDGDGNGDGDGDGDGDGGRPNLMLAQVQAFGP